MPGLVEKQDTSTKDAGEANRQTRSNHTQGDATRHRETQPDPPGRSQTGQCKAGLIGEQWR